MNEYAHVAPRWTRSGPSTSTIAAAGWRSRWPSQIRVEQARAEPAVHLTIDAHSLDTKQTKRDQPLRSADFFDVERRPQVEFISDRATLDGGVLKVHGQLHAAGKMIPLELDATLTHIDGELEVNAITHADHRRLGMTWSPLGILRAPSKLIVSGHLIPQTDNER